MSQYTYTCADCGKPGELVLRRKYDERDLPAKCPVCNGSLSRLEVELCSPIRKKLGGGEAPRQRRRGGIGMRLGPGAHGTQLRGNIFHGLKTGIEAAEGSSFTSQGDKFIDCDTAYDLDGAEGNIRNMDFE